jgi:hypothetical protein
LSRTETNSLGKTNIRIVTFQSTLSKIKLAVLLKIRIKAATDKESGCLKVLKQFCTQKCTLSIFYAYFKDVMLSSSLDNLSYAKLNKNIIQDLPPN